MVTIGNNHRTVTFVFAGQGKPKRVHLVGDFNDWDPTVRRMTKVRDGSFRARLDLPPGEHEYKFVVDGEWLADADAPANRPNCYGSLNSVVVVPDPDEAAGDCGCGCGCDLP
ncbi:MAG: hypothetical protein BWZ02_00670 [Lentisphaerae bacterium ADurb.BinA184]|nr:MAG: hypothetical protein BWZ02_00670 [Lentisphaerae bacterium ADurb.BinA184]